MSIFSILKANRLSFNSSYTFSFSNVTSSSSVEIGGFESMRRIRWPLYSKVKAILCIGYWGKLFVDCLNKSKIIVIIVLSSKHADNIFFSTNSVASFLYIILCLIMNYCTRSWHLSNLNVLLSSLHKYLRYLICSVFPNL